MYGNEEIKNFIPDTPESLMRHLAWQIDRLNIGIEKMCNRLEVLEADYSDRTLKRKIVSILFASYPILMCLILVFSNKNNQEIDSVYQKSQQLLENISHLVAYKD